MITPILRARFLLVTAVLALPLLEGGCGRTACFTWSAEEGQCPAQSEALRFFSSPSCPGHVIAVNSEPSDDFDGQLCCYTVTERSHERGEPDDTCGFGGAGPDSVTSVAIATGVGQGGFGGVSSGGSGGGTSCAHCPEIFNDTATLPRCTFSVELANTLFLCACDVCSAACADTVCQNVTPSDACLVCMQDSSPQGCGDQLAACQFDF